MNRICDIIFSKKERTYPGGGGMNPGGIIPGGGIIIPGGAKDGGFICGAILIVGIDDNPIPRPAGAP